MSNKKNKNKSADKKSTVAKSSSSSSAVKVNVAVAPVAPTMTVAQLIIQFPSGQEITPEDVRAKINTAVGLVERVYIRPDEGKAYWVRGVQDHGAVDLW